LGKQSVIIPATERGVRFLCGSEIGLDTKMDLHVATLEPAPATFSQFRGLRDLLHAQHTEVKVTCKSFHAWRHGKLHMIDGEKLRRIGGVRHGIVLWRSYFFGSGCAVGGTRPLRRRYIAAIP
jgi:hypothetical protein